MLDKRIESHITKDQWIDAVIESLRLEMPIDKLNIPHSSVFYARAAIEAKTGIRLSTAKVQELLYEEGLCPSKDYGIPAWYADKHLGQDLERSTLLGGGRDNRPQESQATA
jgi:hypothetical protein